jgi:hypothetical protein
VILVIVKVVRNVWQLASTVSVLMTIRPRQEQYSRAAIFLTPETGNRVDLGILKFGTRSLDSWPCRNLRRNRSDESGHWKSPKVSQR